jgi:hypothetical protein
MLNMDRYLARRTSLKPAHDGTLSAEPWTTAARSESFVDMASGDPAPLETKAALVWDDECLYVGFWVEEPYPKAHLKERDSIIFTENDVELFIDGGDCYYELEINALGTVYEVFFIWRDAYARGSRFDIPEFDLLTRKALSFAGDFDRKPESFWWGTNPRGPRWAFLDWDFPGLQAKVHVDGTLNEESVKSKGWTVELALPWSGMKHLAGGRNTPPEVGDVWKMFLGRFQKMQTTNGEAQAAWCLTPHGEYDTHMPERFTEIEFR